MNADAGVVVESRLYGLQQQTLLCLDNILLRCGYHIRKGKRDKVIMDTIDALLDTRIDLKRLQEDLKNG